MKNDGGFELGDALKDDVTGFAGVVVAKTFWLNGCVRLTLQPRKVGKDGKPFESQTFDVEQLSLVTRAVVKPSNPSGGPMPEPVRR